MKTSVLLYVEVGLKERLKEAASARGISVNALVNEFLEAALTPQEGPQQPRQATKPFSRWETAALAALDALTAQCADLEYADVLKGNRFFMLREVARAAGLYPSQVLQGLRGLERRKVIVCVDSPDIRKLEAAGIESRVEHWGRVEAPTSG